MMAKPAHLNRRDYLAFEETIASTPTGRAFLRQRDQQARLIAAAEVRRLMRRLMVVVPPKEQGAAPPQTEHVRILRQELQEMSSYIQQTRQEIAALHPDESGKNRIMSATGELDAIVSATERATLDILNAVDRIGVAAARLAVSDAPDSVRSEIETQVTAIMMACSFQDITGQRTTKVVNTLRYIDKRINSMIEIWGIDGSVKPVASENEDSRPDAHLLNGPALEGGVSQGDVDALFGTPDATTPDAALTGQDAIDALFA
jgi:chemotaxis regulatin CheY-phosphate phosphatase CheZ